MTYERSVLQVRNCYDWLVYLRSVFVYLDFVYYDDTMLYLISINSERVVTMLANNDTLNCNHLVRSLSLYVVKAVMSSNTRNGVASTL